MFMCMFGKHSTPSSASLTEAQAAQGPELCPGPTHCGLWSKGFLDCLQARQAAAASVGTGLLCVIAGPMTSCLCVRRRIVEDVCYETRRAEEFVD